MTDSDIRGQLDAYYIAPTLLLPSDKRDWYSVQMAGRAYIDALLHCEHITIERYQHLCTWLYQTVDRERR